MENPSILEGMDKYYELHVTVLPDDVLGFTAFCEKIKAKPLYIQLSQGRHPDQLMLAAAHMLSDDKQARAWADDYGNMVKRNFPVIRTKLESRLVDGPNEYYEAHWKLDFKHDREYWTCATLDFGLANSLLLHSRSLLDTRIHYLSQRIYNMTDPIAASTAFNASGVKINFHGLPLVKAHYERVVYDSNQEIDNGWAI